MKLTFEGGVGTVTGANFLLEDSGGKKILIDCGLLQGASNADAINRDPFSYDPASIDAVFITHAHMDHIGRVPKLVKDGFKGDIYSTPVTKEISKLMLEDAVKLLEGEAREKGLLPLYEQKDADGALGLWKEIPFHSPFELGEGIAVTFKDSGHILGSAMIEFKRNNRSVTFTGDLGNSPSLFLPDTESVNGTTYLVMESVYGDRNHESKEDRQHKFVSIVKDVVAKKRTLVIPAFSLERTQDILYELNRIVEGGIIPAIPVFIDSPLATKVTAVYARSKDYFNESARQMIQGGDNLFDFPRLKFFSKPGGSAEIDRMASPKIIIAGSGMSNGGRITSHEKRYLPDPNATILLAGYQSLGTLGRRIQDGSKEVEIYGDKIPVRAKVETIFGYSSHKDSDHLIQFVEDAAGSLEKVFVAMGEPKASLFLVQRLKDYTGVDALYPKLHQTLEIDV